MADAESASPNKKKSSFPFKHLTALRKPAARGPSVAANGPDRDRDAADADSLSFFQQSRSHALPAPLPEAKRRLKKDRRGDLTPERVLQGRKRRKISLEHHSDADSVTDAEAEASEADDHPNRAKPSSPRKSQRGKEKQKEKEKAISPILRASPETELVNAAAHDKSKRVMRSGRATQPAPITILDDSDSADSHQSRDNSREASPRAGDALVEDDTNSVTHAKEDDPDDDLAEYVANVRARAANASKDPVAILLTSPLPGTKPVKVQRLMNQPLAAVLNCWVLSQANHGLHWPEKQVFMTWKKNKIYNSTTAASLGIQVDSDGRILSNTRDGYTNGGLHIEVWTDELYAKYLVQKEADRALEFGLNTVDNLAESDEEEVAPAEEQRAGCIILKARDMESLRVKISSNTTVADLIKAFRGQRNAGKASQVVIYNEGEELDQDSLVTDIDDLEEDEDTMLEVHIR